jgi:hypothetical protein
MVWSRLTTQARRPGRLLTVLFALSSLSMPVDYRGGAELPHAHALFQFWMSGDADAFDHHGEHHESVAHHHDDVAATLRSNVDPSPDTPAISGMGGPAETGSVMALSLLLSVVLFAAGRNLLIATWTRVLVGIRPSPELPPPRQAIALVW